MHTHLLYLLELLLIARGQREWLKLPILIVEVVHLSKIHWLFNGNVWRLVESKHWREVKSRALRNVVIWVVLIEVTKTHTQFPFSVKVGRINHVPLIKREASTS